MISEHIAAIGSRARDRLVVSLARFNLSPNFLTLFGLVVNILAAVLFGLGQFFYAGLVLIVAGAFDILDGSLARRTQRVTKFGAFFDSVLDRYSDLVVFIGIMIFYARDTAHHSTLYVALTGIALMGSVMVSYTRARAESLIAECKVGFLERPERMVLLIIGCFTEAPWIGPSYFFHKMPAVLWVLAVLSHWTVAHRMYYTWKQLQPATPPSESVVASRQSVSAKPAANEWVYLSHKNKEA
ncbi:MAG: CDP-alcohol phosphatidyltransferase family protein [Acidobacteriota bacterium]|nr:CDP-alcohol phosphatidyltransferase family protein [Blastocatellia bacterium]MDW8238143.1 CDP-alcohol phosphatidyltransferase family protein [Acidobacteriota bacterium]